MKEPNGDILRDIESIISMSELKSSATALKQFKDVLIEAGFSTEETFEIVKQTAMAFFLAHFKIIKVGGEND